MVFKVLVEAIVKLHRNPDNVLALNTINTLTRDLKNDLNQAYDLSGPLIQRHRTLFWESNSFLDFLLKLYNLPLNNYELSDSSSRNDDLKRKLIEKDKLYDALKNEVDDLKKKLIEKDKLHDDLKKRADDRVVNLEGIIDDLNKQLYVCKSENDNINQLLTQTKQMLENYKQSFTECKKSLDDYEKRKYELMPRLNNSSERSITYHQHEPGGNFVNYSTSLVTNLPRRVIKAPNHLSSSLIEDPESMIYEENVPRLGLSNDNESNQNADLEAQNEKLTADNNKLINDKESLIKQLKEAHKQITDLKTSIQQLEKTQLTSLTADNNKLVNDKESLEKEMKDAHERITNLKTRIQELEKSSRNIAENKVIAYLQNQYSNRSQWEDDFIADWEYKTISLKQVDQQFTKIENAFDRVKLNYADFGNIIIELYKNVPKRSEVVQNIVQATPDENMAEVTVSDQPNDCNEKMTILKNAVTSLTFIKNPNWFDTLLKIIPEFQLLYNHVIEKISTVEDETISTDETEWINLFIHFNDAIHTRFHSADGILSDIMSLTPYISTTNKHEWKNKFIENYTNLQDFIEKICHPSQLKEFEKNLERNVSILDSGLFNEKEWIGIFIAKIIDFTYHLSLKYPPTSDFNHWIQYMLNEPKSESSEPKSELIKKHKARNLSSKPRNEPVKKSSRFKKTKSKDSSATIYNKISAKNKQYVSNNNAIKAYFEITEVSLQHIIQKIQTVLEHQYTLLDIQKPTEDFENLTFDNYFNYYFIPIKQKYFESTNFLTFYKKWLQVLNLPETSPFEDFSERLTQYKQKCTLSNKRSQSLELNVASKKRIMDENWTIVEIQKLFYMLFKAYFTIKVDAVKGITLESEDVVKQIQNKLKILADVKNETRQNDLLNLYNKYIEYDLETWIGNEVSWNSELDVMSKDELLDKCMKDTTIHVNNMLKQIDSNQLNLFS